MNDDASTFELPEYIHSRLQPQILIDFPEKDEEYQILKENLPFAEDRILQYVTDFLQQAHAADERYSVRDGINIARYAIKLKSLATGREHERMALETACSKRWARRHCDMSGETGSYQVLSRSPDWSEPRARPFHLSARVPGRLEFAIEVRRRILAERPDVVAVELPETLEDVYLDAIRRLPQISVIFYNDTAPRSRPAHDDEAGSGRLCAGGAGRSVCGSHPQRAGNRRAGRLRRSRFHRAAAPARHLSRFLRAAHRFRSASMWKRIGVYPQERTAGSGAVRRRIAWKLQGADPLARVLVVLSLNLLDPVLDAMEKPQPEPTRRRREESASGESRIRIAWARSHPNIRFCRSAMRCSAWRCASRRMVDRRRVQMALFREAEHAYVLNTGEKMHRWQRRLLAQLQPQPRADAPRSDARRCSISPSRRARSWMRTMRGMSGKPPRATRHQQTSSDIETVKISGDEVWLNTRRIRLRRRLPSTKRRLGNLGLEAAQEGKVSRRVGERTERREYLLLSARRYGDRGFRALSEEERARAFCRKSAPPWSRLPLRCSMASICARPFATGTRARFSSRISRRFTAKSGSVVVIFDEDRDGRYNYMTTWLGEHQNESDMAFYSTRRSII